MDTDSPAEITTQVCGYEVTATTPLKTSRSHPRGAAGGEPGAFCLDHTFHIEVV